MSGVKRRGSSAASLRMEMNDAERHGSSSGADMWMDTIPGSQPVTPGFELTINPMDLPPPTEAISKEKIRGGGQDFSVEEHELVFTTDGHGVGNVRTRDNAALNNEGLELSDYDDSCDNLRLNWKDPPKNKYRILACCIWTFTGGLSDGAPGALLPSIESYYDISYAIVSMIWFSCAVGYIVIAVSTHLLLKKLPKHQLSTLGIVFQLIMNSLVCSGTVFPVICVGFFFNGMGLALGLTQYNVFLSSFSNASTCLGFLHGSYGIGALVAPLVAQSMLNNGSPWYRYYFLLLGMCIVNFFFVYWAYYDTSKDLAQFEEAEAQRIEMEKLQSQREKGDGYKESSEIVAAIKDYRTWLLCGFVFFYQGSEVSIGGWIVSFLLNERDGNEKYTGYVASGYWGGLTFGRFALTTLLHNKIGGRRSILLLTEAMAALLLIAWLVKNIYVSATCSALTGLFIGPIYPLMVALISNPIILPRRILSSSLLIMTSMGSSGGAIVPLLVGIISDVSGTWVLFPIVIALLQLMILCWLLLPNAEKSNKKRTFFGREF